MANAAASYILNCLPMEYRSLMKMDSSRRSPKRARAHVQTAIPTKCLYHFFSASRISVRRILPRRQALARQLHQRLLIQHRRVVDHARYFVLTRHRSIRLRTRRRTSPLIPRLRLTETSSAKMRHLNAPGLRALLPRVLTLAVSEWNSRVLATRYAWGSLLIRHFSKVVIF
jgi:hypothetical protein